MSTETPSYELEWRELAGAAFAVKGITEGLWRLAVKLRYAGVTSAWPDPGGAQLTMPTALVGVEGLALFAATEPGPLVFDAAELSTGAAKATKAIGAPLSAKRTPVRGAIRSRGDVPAVKKRAVKSQA